MSESLIAGKGCKNRAFQARNRSVLNVGVAALARETATGVISGEGQPLQRCGDENRYVAQFGASSRSR
jgi:hypothetical protein